MLESETQFDRHMARVQKYMTQETILIEQPLVDRSIRPAEFEALLSLYHPKHRVRLQFEILWFSGMRRQEVAWLQRDNFNHDFTELVYKVCKPRNRKNPDGTTTRLYKSRRVKLPLDLGTRLKQYYDGIRLVSPFGFMFPTYSKVRIEQGYFYENPGVLNHELDKVRPRLGGRWLQKKGKDHLLGLHGFRRSWITRRLEQTKDISKTAKEIGHSQTDVTFTYYQLTDSDKAASEALEASRIPSQETELEALRREVAELRALVQGR